MIECEIQKALILKLQIEGEFCSRCYPYRGKISALDADQILKQIPKGSVVLDPFCGSGTIVYEDMDLKPLEQT